MIGIYSVKFECALQQSLQSYQQAKSVTILASLFYKALRHLWKIGFYRMKNKSRHSICLSFHINTKWKHQLPLKSIATLPSTNFKWASNSVPLVDLKPFNRAVLPLFSNFLAWPRLSFVCAIVFQMTALQPFRHSLQLL